MQNKLEFDNDNKMSYEEFIKMAILKLRKSPYKGIHSVYSGFNVAFRKYFDEDPIKITQELNAQNIIAIRPVKGGVMLYLPEEAPATRDDVGSKALSIILNTVDKPSEGLIEKFVQLKFPEGVKSFPKNFVDWSENKTFVEIQIPKGALNYEGNSNVILVNKKLKFKRECKNPIEAKYLLYSSRFGFQTVKLPIDNIILFKIVNNYEKFCGEILNDAHMFFLRETNNEANAEILANEFVRKYNYQTI